MYTVQDMIDMTGITIDTITEMITITIMTETLTGILTEEWGIINIRIATDMEDVKTRFGGCFGLYFFNSNIKSKIAY